MVLERPRPGRIAALLALVGVAVGIYSVSWFAAGESSPVGVDEWSGTVVYGDAPGTFGRLHVPAIDSSDRAPIVVLVHGGFWRRRSADLAVMEPLASDLVARGFAVWNIEYGRTGERFGGWPHTFDHVAAAVDHVAVLAEDHPLDLGAVSVVGHSAGGHLALWVAGRQSADAQVSLRSVVGLAPIVDLRRAADDLLGEGAVIDLLGGAPGEVPERYAAASPVPDASVRTLIVLGAEDDDVPAVYSEHAGVEPVVVPGVGHLGLIDPEGPAWEVVVDWLESGIDGRS